MKKGLSALVFVLVAMIMLVSNVFAAPAQFNGNISLESVTYERGGIVLLFHTSGLSQNNLNNTTFTAHSEQWNMDCKFVDGTTTVRCLVSKKLAMFADESFHGTLAGSYFAGVLPGARTFPSPVVTETLVITETPSQCSDGQTLSYTFEYSNSSYQAEVWSDYYMDADTFHSLYGFYPEYSSTYTDSYSWNGVDNTTTYYIYGYTTTTSGYGSTPADNWDDLVAAYESDGYNIQKTGESCD